MAQGVQAWSTTAASNASADANINWAEGQLGPTVNNSARAQMAAMRAFANTIGGGVTYGGSSNAYTITNDSIGAWSSLAAPRMVMLKANHTNTGAATVAVDGLTATAIRKNGTTALSSGDIQSGALYLLAYDGTYFQIVGSIGAVSTSQPLDATLTALAALTIASGKLIKGTGTDTFTTIDISTLGESIINVADEAAFKTLLNLETGIDVQGYDVDTAKTDVSSGWTAGQAIPPLVSSEASGTLTAASRNRVVVCTGAVTLDDGVFTAGDAIVFDSNGASRTFTRAAGLTMYLNGVDSASATLAADKLGTAFWRSSTVVVLGGAFA